jgi:2,3-bisphosphoglycerate-dependent phosphoglycerate mutase
MRGFHDLVLGRHGQTHGNVAHYEANQNGNKDYFTQEFRDRPGHTWELTPYGWEQAEQTGAWIRKNIQPQLVGGCFSEAFTSPYTRPIQTAVGYNIPNIKWQEPEPKLRERDWGDIEAIPSEEYFKLELYKLNRARRMKDYLNWAPPNGESLAQVMVRLENFYNDIRNERHPASVLCATHGEVMTASRGIIEHIRTGRRLAALKKRKNQQIDNASLIWYRDRHPESVAERDGELRFVRIVNAPNNTDTGWIEIRRKTYTSEELLDLVA